MAGMEASMTFSAKYVKRELEVTDSKEAAAMCIALPKAALDASSMAGGGTAERALSVGRKETALEAVGAKADETPIEERANAEVTAACLKNAMIVAIFYGLVIPNFRSYFCKQLREIVDIDEILLSWCVDR